MIKKEGQNWVLYSEDGLKRLFESKSRNEVENREREINYFKNKPKVILRKKNK